jgi:protein O-mannosyl-transferase
LVLEPKVLIRLVTASIIVVTLSVVSFMRSGFYRDELTLFTDTASKSPNKDRVLNNLALELMNVNRYSDAMPLIERAIALNPDYVAAKNNMALTFYSLGLKTDAEVVFAEIVEHYPSSKEAPFAGKMLALIRRSKQRQSSENTGDDK